MRLLLSILLALCLSHYSPQKNSHIYFFVENKEKYIIDSIKFEITNSSKDTVNFTISIEVLDHNNWTEFYPDIFEFNRDAIKRFKLLPFQRREFKYSINKIHKDYQKLFNKKKFRLGMNIFPKDPFKNISKIVSNTFLLKWSN